MAQSSPELCSESGARTILWTCDDPWPVGNVGGSPTLARPPDFLCSICLVWCGHGRFFWAHQLPGVSGSLLDHFCGGCAGTTAKGILAKWLGSVEGSIEEMLNLRIIQKALVFALVAAGFFSYGLIVGHYQFAPFN